MDNRFYYWKPSPNPENGKKEPDKWDCVILILAMVAVGSIFLYMTNNIP